MSPFQFLPATMKPRGKMPVSIQTFTCLTVGLWQVYQGGSSITMTAAILEAWAHWNVDYCVGSHGDNLTATIGVAYNISASILKFSKSGPRRLRRKI